MLRFGTIGTGWIANSYVDGALDSGLWQLTAIYSRTKEKGLAFAAPYGVKTVFIPEENKKDLEEVDAVVKDHITFVPVSHVSDVLKGALSHAPKAKRKKSASPSAPPIEKSAVKTESISVQ